MFEIVESIEYCHKTKRKAPWSRRGCWRKNLQGYNKIQLMATPMKMKCNSDTKALLQTYKIKAHKAQSLQNGVTI